jgi:hypothetical protein
MSSKKQKVDLKYVHTGDMLAAVILESKSITVLNTSQLSILTEIGETFLSHVEAPLQPT